MAALAALSAAIRGGLGDAAANPGRFPGGTPRRLLGGRGGASGRIAEGVEVLECVMGGGLLGGLLGGAAAVADDPASHHGVSFVLAAMSGTAGGSHPVPRRRAGAVLGDLLELPLVVLVAPVGEVADVLDEDPGRNPESLIEEDRPDERLKRVREQRRKPRRARLGRAPAEQQGLTELEPLRQPGERHGVDESCPQLRQLAFVVFGKPLEEVLTRDELEDRISEILEPLVVVAGPTALAPLVVP